MSTPRHNGHPDYSDGYFDALDGTPLPDNPSAPYREGWDNGNRARDLMRRNGFQQDGPARFSKATVIRK